MKQERRGHPRIPEQVELSLQHDRAALQAETKNLSASGVYCMVDSFLPPMTKLQVDFALPHGASAARIRCTGVVVRVDPILSSLDRWRYSIGIFFSDLSDRDRSAIAHYVKQRLSQAAS
ncbi:MAG: PilZ domain-containing protein [Candidatus Omnitrophica bacterium]|nr:PilZ domain-containing protein [Candidatus Omnitrophota bacterium]